MSCQEGAAPTPTPWSQLALSGSTGEASGGFRHEDIKHPGIVLDSKAQKAPPLPRAPRVPDARVCSLATTLARPAHQQSDFSVPSPHPGLSPGRTAHKRPKGAQPVRPAQEPVESQTELSNPQSHVLKPSPSAPPALSTQLYQERALREVTEVKGGH